MKNPEDFAKKIKFRTLGLFVLGGAIFLSGTALWFLVQDTAPPEYYSYILLAIWALCIFVSSIFVIKYKEMPRFGLPSIKGWFAILSGIVSLIISGLGFIFSVYEAAIRILYLLKQ